MIPQKETRRLCVGAAGMLLSREGIGPCPTQHNPRVGLLVEPPVLAVQATLPAHSGTSPQTLRLRRMTLGTGHPPLLLLGLP